MRIALHTPPLGRFGLLLFLMAATGPAWGQDVPTPYAITCQPPNGTPPQVGNGGANSPYYDPNDEVNTVAYVLNGLPYNGIWYENYFGTLSREVATGGVGSVLFLAKFYIDPETGQLEGHLIESQAGAYEFSRGDLRIENTVWSADSTEASFRIVGTSPGGTHAWDMVLDIKLLDTGSTVSHVSASFEGDVLFQGVALAFRAEGIRGFVMAFGDDPEQITVSNLYIKEGMVYAAPAPSTTRPCPPTKPGPHRTTTINTHPAGQPYAAGANLPPCGA